MTLAYSRKADDLKNPRIILEDFGLLAFRVAPLFW